MKKSLITLGLLMCFAFTANALAAEVGVTSNSTVQGPAFNKLFTDITPAPTPDGSGNVATGQRSITLQLTAEANTARGWGLGLDGTQAAIDFMFANGLTRFGSADTYMGSNTLRRDEAATFYSRFAAKALGMTPDKNRAGCEFSDMAQVDANLKDDVVIACQMGLFKGHDGKFMPTDRLTLGQALTVLIRIIHEYKSESSDIHWAHEYRQSAYALGLTSDTAVQLNNQINRADVAKLIEAAAVIEQVKAKAKAEGYAAIRFENTASKNGGQIVLLTEKDADVSTADKKTVIGGLGSISSRYWIDIK